MPRIVKIEDMEMGTDYKGRAFRCLGFDIRDLLKVVPAEGQKLTWSIFPMGREPTEVTGDLSSVGLSVEQLEKQIESSPTGMVMTSERLLVIAEAIQQTIWGLYIGCRDAADFEQIAALPPEERQFLDTACSAFYERVEIGFQAIDSSFWLAYARDDAVIERISAAFSVVTVVASW